MSATASNIGEHIQESQAQYEYSARMLVHNGPTGLDIVNHTFINRFGSQFPKSQASQLENNVEYLRILDFPRAIYARCSAARVDTSFRLFRTHVPFTSTTWQASSVDSTFPCSLREPTILRYESIFVNETCRNTQ